MIALFMNHHKLGGAEISALEQAKILGLDNIDLFKPLNQEDEIPSSGFSHIRFFKYPSLFEKLTRESKRGQFQSIFLSLPQYLNLLKINLSGYQKIWFNGLKVFTLFSPIIFLLYPKKNIILSMRDYPVSHWVLKLIFWCFRKRAIYITVMANSKSVKESFKKLYPHTKVTFCYNPYSVAKTDKSLFKKRGVIGTASMLTPWKGVHEVVSLFNKYEKELLDIGISKCLIYGDMIYHTKAEHLNYKEQLESLNSNQLVNFKGKASTQEIFDTISILIHSSLKPEPFGRVILEAFANKVLVFSTGLGGSRELFEGLEDQIFDFESDELINKLKDFMNNEEMYDRAVQKQLENYRIIQEQSKTSIRKVFKL